MLLGGISRRESNGAFAASSYILLAAILLEDYRELRLLNGGFMPESEFDKKYFIWVFLSLMALYWLLCSLFLEGFFQEDLIVIGSLLVVNTLNSVGFSLAVLKYIVYPLFIR